MSRPILQVIESELNGWRVPMKDKRTEEGRRSSDRRIGDDRRLRSKKEEPKEGMIGGFPSWMLWPDPSDK